MDASVDIPGPPVPPPLASDRRARFRAGLRAAVPFALSGVLLSASFGVLALASGFTKLSTIAMSAIVFAGSAQFTSVTILAAGGSFGAALVGATLVNLRFLPMGVALAPSLPGGWAARAAQGQAVVDASWAMAMQDDGSFDRFFLFGATSIQYVTWFSGTVAGVFAGGLLGDTDRLGLDAIYPAFFLALLITETRGGRALGVAALGATIALVLVPLTPVGVPVLVASLAAIVGSWGRAR